MRLVHGFCLFSLLGGCSEYKFDSVNDDPFEADEEREEDEIRPLEPDDDTGATELPPDEGIDEDPAEDPDDPTDDPPGEDEEPCTDTVTAFDIEEVSTLQDAVSPFLAANETALGIFSPWYRDALILDYTVPESGEGESWRISAVYVLVMVASGRFDMFADGQPLTVEVFDSNDPRTVTGWTKTESVVKGDLEWSDYSLPTDAAISGSFAEYTQKGAWMRFDMTGVIPETGMTADQFVVGIQWETLSQVAVGYSNFNRACNRNWTEWEPGSGWNLNGTSDADLGCSWPMLRVEVEHSYAEDC